MKISLRSLFLMVTMLAIALGWWLDHMRLQNANTLLNTENTELMGRVMPSSGFAFPSGLISKTQHSHSSIEDRKEFLFLLDHSWTHGRDATVSLD